jgi:hypothetical protein
MSRVEYYVMTKDILISHRDPGSLFIYIILIILVFFYIDHGEIQL